jgi:hypothetical protein
MDVFVDNDNLVTVDAVQDEATGDYINDATVELTLLDADGDEATGETWPIALAYVASSDGKYQGTIESAVDILSGKRYTARIDISATGGLVGRIDAQVTARVRRS